MLQIKGASPRSGTLQLGSTPDRGGVLSHHALSSSISSTVSAEWAIPARRALEQGAGLRKQSHVLMQTLRLPDSLQSFLLFTLGVAILCIGLTLHLQLSTTILQDKIRLAELQAEEQALKEQTSNLVWTIVQETELTKVKERATALGYQPALTRHYIVAPTDARPIDSQVATMQASE
ncbi:MAG: hypothetical protein R3E79_18965 [Caldilineaceae bacterium]